MYPYPYVDRGKDFTSFDLFALARYLISTQTGTTRKITIHITWELRIGWYWAFEQQVSAVVNFCLIGGACRKQPQRWWRHWWRACIRQESASSWGPIGRRGGQRCASDFRLGGRRMHKFILYGNTSIWCRMFVFWNSGIEVIKYWDCLIFKTWVLWQLSQVTLQHHSNLHQQNLRIALWNLNVTCLIINQSERLKSPLMFVTCNCMMWSPEPPSWKKEKLNHFATLPV